MSFHAPISLPGKLATNPFLGRKAERMGVKMRAGLRQRGAGAVDVRVIDLSTHGFRAECHLDLAVGTDIWLRLPGLEAWHATVAWQEGYVIGCAFERPLHAAVLNTLLRRT